MKSSGKVLGLVVLSILALSSLLSVAQASNFYITKVFVEPAEISVQCGQTFEVSVSVSDITRLQAFDFMLKYDNRVLKCLSVEEGTFLSSAGTTFVAKKEINNELCDTCGRVWLAVVLLGKDYVNGSGTLAVIKFNATAGGESVLDLYSNPPYEPDLIKLSTCNPYAIGHNVIDGHVVVTCPAPVECKVTFLTEPVCSDFNITFQGATYHNGSVGTFVYGTSGSAAAKCGAGYVFDHWLVSGNVSVSSTTANPTTVTIKCGGTLKAIFKAHPCASFTAQMHSPNVTFNASASFDPDGRIVGYTWNFGDGATATVSDPVTIHDYLAGGTYDVTLTVIDNDSLTDSAGRSLTVKMLSADFNDDGTVDVVDLSMVGKAFKSKVGEPNWKEMLDIDHNGIINIVDIAIAAKEFGKTT